MTALAKEPARRYQSAAAMGQDLERVVGVGAGVLLRPGAAGPTTDPLGSPSAISGQAPTVGVAARAAARRPGPPRWALLAGAGIALMLAVAVWSLRGGSGTGAGQAGPGPATPAHTTTTSAQATTTATSRSESSLSAARPG
jgi:hypothetical protein